MKTIYIGIVAIALLIVAITTPVLAQLSVNVCHATGSAHNPYNLVIVSVHSVDDATGLNGHGSHTDDGWLPFTYEGVDYPGRNVELFGSVIDENCSPITPTVEPPTATIEHPTPTLPIIITDTPTSLTPTHVYTLEPTDTTAPTGSPREDVTPVYTPTLPSTPTVTFTPTPVSTNAETPAPTETPRPPVPAVAYNAREYISEFLGKMIVNHETFNIYQGINAPDGSLMLPSNIKGAALYNNVIWVHRLWSSGWLDIRLGSVVKINDTRYIVSNISFIDYGIYPKTIGSGIKYIATCYQEDGRWSGVMLYQLTLANKGE
jgi:hypothetical protein